MRPAIQSPSPSLRTLGAGSWFSAKFKDSVPPLPRQPPPLVHVAVTKRLFDRKHAPDAEPDQKKGRFGNSEKPPANITHKIRIYPTVQQRQTLMRWFGTARWTYNECVRQIESNGVEKNLLSLRQVAVHNGVMTGDRAWVLETPYEIRDAAMQECLQAYRTNMKRVKAGGITHFHMQFRSKKRMSSQSISILGRNWGRKKGEFSFLRNLKAAEPLPDVMEYDFRIQLAQLGEFFICIQSRHEVRPEHQGPLKMIALDPGIRTFAVGYDPSGLLVEWGKQDIGLIYRLCHANDALQGKCDTSGPGRKMRHKRWRMRRAGMRIRKRIRALVDELHCKLAKWLCGNYDLILLPTFETQKMLRKGQRRINSKTARAMATWSHYRFRQRLQSKAREYPSCVVELVDEAYTSKTCGRCGAVHWALGGSKHFHCPRCHFALDRDTNGARNILLRYMSERV